MAPLTAEEHLALAEKHLVRVQESWDKPVDWLALASFGFYCLENAVSAAAAKVGEPPTTKHWEKAAIARRLAKKHKLPDVSRLMADLNEARKSEAYGDIDFPDELDPEDVASEIESFVEEVKKFVAK